MQRMAAVMTMIVLFEISPMAQAQQTKPQPPIAEKKPTSIVLHGDTRVDN